MARSFSKKNNLKNNSGSFIIKPRFGNKSLKRASKKVPKQYEISVFTNPAVSLELLHPLTFDVFYDNKLYIVENEVFNIFSFDRDFEKAKMDIELQIYDLWEDFVLADISSLAPSGVWFRNLLKSYLAEKQ